MSYCKFKYGDKVIANGHKGTVVSIAKEMYYGTYSITVKFDDKKLIPNKMNFGEVDLEFAPEDQVPPPIPKTKKEEIKCNCGIKATYGDIHASRHKHYCDLYKQHMNPKKDEDEYADLLREFEIMLGDDDDDDDDDDDFGFFGI